MDSLNEKKLRLEQIMPLVCESLVQGNDVRFSPKGTSMLPMLRQGIDSVVISPIPEEIKKYDLPLYKRANGQFVLHRVVKTGNTFTCIGDNQFEYEYGIEKEQIIGVVTEFYRGDKKQSVNSAMHRLYCMFWHHSRPVRRIWRKTKDRIKKIIK